MKKRDDIKMIFFSEKQYAICEKEIYLKGEILKAIESNYIDSEKKKIKKTVDNKKIIYQFILDDKQINIYMPNKYELDNLEYMDIFDKWIQNNKKDFLKKLRLAVIVATASVAATAASYESIKDLLTDEVQDLENELLIHSGNAKTPDGRNVSPFLGHGCVFDEDTSLTIEERIEDYCEDHDLDYMTEIAIEKWNHLNSGNEEFAETIDLKEIEKEYKALQKKKN